VFLDTNILVFLVDNTFEALNNFIELINESQFVELVSSKYAMFEFIGARKREHYLRIAAQRSPKTAGGEINFTSLLKFKDDYQTPGTVFEDVIPNIKAAVNAEVNEIFERYKIYFDYGTLHDGQLEPTRDLCLSSKLANQDCMILVSAVLPEKDKTFPSVLLLTNDKAFVDFAKSPNLDVVLNQYSIPSPQLVPLNNIQHKDSTAMNLTAAIDQVSLKERTKQYLLMLIREKASSHFLGTTIAITGTKVPKNCVAFRITGRENLPPTAYVTILSKDLDFIYTTKVATTFVHNGREVRPNQTFSEANNNIAFQVRDIDDSGSEKEVVGEILAAIREPGHSVFIHPDSV